MLVASGSKFPKVYRYLQDSDSTFFWHLNSSGILFVSSHRRVSFHSLTIPVSRNVVLPFAFSKTHILQAFTFFWITSFVTQICPTQNVPFSTACMFATALLINLCVFVLMLFFRVVLTTKAPSEILCASFVKAVVSFGTYSSLLRTILKFALLIYTSSFDL